MANATEEKINLAVTLSISSVIILVNTVSILITLSKVEIRRKRRYKFFLSLLSSHLMLGLVLIIHSIILWFSNKHDKYSTILINAVATTLLCATVSLTIDRFICIKYPFRYSNLPKKFNNLIISVSWIVGIIYVIVNINFTNYTTLITPIIVLNILAVITLPACNTMIFKESRKHIKNIYASMVYRGDTNASKDYSMEASNGKETRTSINEDKSIGRNRKASPEDLRKIIILKKEIRAAYICILLMTSYFICWLPITVHMFLTSEIDSFVRRFALYVAMLNSVADPLIYISLSSELKSVITAKKFSRRKKCKISVHRELCN